MPKMNGYDTRLEIVQDNGQWFVRYVERPRMRRWCMSEGTAILYARKLTKMHKAGMPWPCPVGVDKAAA